MMFTSQRPITVPLSYLVGVSSTINKATNGVFDGLLGAAGVPALHVDIIGRAAVEAIADESISGSVEPATIEVLGARF